MMAEREGLEAQLRALQEEHGLEGPAEDEQAAEEPMDGPASPRSEAGASLPSDGHGRLRASAPYHRERVLERLFNVLARFRTFWVSVARSSAFCESWSLPKLLSGQKPTNCTI